MNNAPRIAIIGGGPGGLVLARHLQRHGLAATIFELDAHPLARPQGGSLDLHAESGLRALRELGLEHEFLAVARYDDQGGAIYDVAGVCHHVDDGTNDDGTPGERPEIDRTQLRALLLASLDDGTVVWDSKVRRVVADGDRWRVQGTNSGGGDIDLGTFDLVVGADGAWSKVRPLLSAAQPDYLGLLCYELMIEDVDNLHSDVAALLPHGKVTVVAEGRGLIAQRSSNGHVRVYVMLRVADDVVDAHHLERLPPAETRAQLVQVLGLSSSVSCLVTAANDTITRRPIVALPVGHRWDHRRGLTLVGDAAHVMSPFSGEGVNMAMLDGLELGLAITSALSTSTSSSSLDAAIAEAEARLFVRAADAAAGANAAASTWPAQ
ncbi:MAG TPA: NAD(P)/FAD-dependent oxidoreductase, partial [Myxococcota bacterium]